MSVEWLTITELAAWLHLRERRVQALVHQGMIPYVKIGRQVFFNVQDIEDWLKSNRYPATMPATQVVTKGILAEPKATDGPPISLVPGPKGRNRERLKRHGG